MRLLLVLFCCTNIISCLAQSKEEDEANYQQAIDWLDRKLNYIYYDEVSGKWWKNTFYVNEKKEVTIKHISSSKPNTANIQSKNYTIRTFRLADINPLSLQIREESDSRGRIVKGKVLEMRTFSGEKSIHKKINTRKGSSTSFLFLSFPEFLNDSLADYAGVVKAKLSEAILASTKVYWSSREENIETTMSVLTGQFINEQQGKWIAERRYPKVIQITSPEDAEIFFGYDQSKALFYYTSITNQGLETTFYTFGQEENIQLVEVDGESAITLKTKNTFQKDGVSYFRQ